MKEKKDKEAKARKIIADAEAEHRRHVMILLAVFGSIAIAALAVLTFFVCRWKIQKRRADRNAQGEPLIAEEEKQEKVWEVITSTLEVRKEGAACELWRCGCGAEKNWERHKRRELWRSRNNFYPKLLLKTLLKLFLFGENEQIYLTTGKKSVQT